MNYTTKVEFYIFSEFDEVSPTPTKTFTEIFNSKLDTKKVSSSYSTLKFIPRKLRFSLLYNDVFFDTLKKSENYIKEINRYYIKAYDENDTVYFTGLIKRTDLKIDQKKEFLNITANDLVLLYSLVKDTLVTPTQVLDNSLTNIDNLYNYYLDLGLKYYFGDSFVTTSYKSIDYDTSQDIRENVEYNDKDIKIQDMINMFFSINSHAIRYDELNNEVIIDDTNKFVLAVASISLNEDDILENKESNLTIAKFDNQRIFDILSSDESYQETRQAIINENDFQYNYFTSSVNKKLSIILSTLKNSYSLDLNQVIKISNDNYSIKGIREYKQYCDLELWNSRNPKTNSILWIAIPKLDSISGGKPNNNILWIPMSQIEGNGDNNNILWISTQEIINNGPNNKSIWITSNKL